MAAVRTRSIVIALALGASLAVALPAAATTVYRFSDDELVAQSRYIVEGTVESVASGWNAEHSQIYTTIELALGEVVKGSLPGPTLRLRLPGGTADGITMTLVGMPTFAVGDDDLLFLGPNPQSFFPIVGLSQGKFTFVRDDATGLQRVRERATSRQAFVQRIRALVKP